MLIAVQIWRFLSTARLAAWVHLIMLTGQTNAQGMPQTHSVMSCSCDKAPQIHL